LYRSLAVVVDRIEVVVRTAAVAVVEQEQLRCCCFHH